ncbi:MAG: hypothetical protein C0622_03485 [Desulfuromonas sp.]|nr:MAG: hypothetical protein C0622_03485 [Desulfuromonas sp.]
MIHNDKPSELNNGWLVLFVECVHAPIDKSFQIRCKSGAPLNSNIKNVKNISAFILVLVALAIVYATFYEAASYSSLPVYPEAEKVTYHTDQPATGFNSCTYLVESFFPAGDLMLLSTVNSSVMVLNRSLAHLSLCRVSGTRRIRKL